MKNSLEQTCQHGNIVHLQPDEVHCYWHCIEKLQETDYIICGECSHIYRSGFELLEEHNKVLRELTEIEHVEPGVRETDPDLVPTCPLCIHDF